MISLDTYSMIWDAGIHVGYMCALYVFYSRGWMKNYIITPFPLAYINTAVLYSSTYAGQYVSKVSTPRVKARWFELISGILKHARQEMILINYLSYRNCRHLLS